MSHIIPQFFVTSVNLKQIDFSNDSFKCALFTGDYNEGILRDTRYYNQVSASEVSSAGNYPKGGIPLTGNVVSADDINNSTNFAFNNIVFSASSGNIEDVRYAGIYNISNQIMVAFLDFSKYRNIIENTTLSINFPTGLIFNAYQKT